MSAIVIDFSTGQERKEQQECSFCKKKTDDVKKMLSDPTEKKYICNECIVKAKRMLGDCK